MVAVTGSWASSAPHAGRPSSQARLLVASPVAGRHGVEMAGAPRGRRASPSASRGLVGGMHIPGDRARSERLDLPAVPAGRYAVVVTRHGPVTVAAVHQIGHAPIPAATIDVRDRAEGDPVQFDLTFPVAVASWDVGRPEGPRALPIAVTVRPRRSASSGRAAGRRRRAVAYGSLLAFFMDDGAYAEPGGFWIRRPRRDGRRRAPERPAITAAPGRSKRADREPLDVSAGKWRDRGLAPGEERVITAPPPGADPGDGAPPARGSRRARLRLRTRQPRPSGTRRVGPIRAVSSANLGHGEI